MPFACPECGRKHSLIIMLAMELPPDNRSDEITLQVVDCSGCGFTGIAVYEESRRGAMGSEACNHTGYRVARPDAAELAALIRTCPQPGNRSCTCSAHRKLGSRDQNGRWNELPGMASCAVFEMVYSPLNSNPER